MALAPCRECGREVSDQAVACPSCGAPTKRGEADPAPRQGFSALAGCIGVLACVAIGGTALSLLGPRGGSGALRLGPQTKTIVSERVELQEGEAKAYAFWLPSNGRVTVSVAAGPKPVNVMLMTDDDYKNYNAARGKLLGGKYTYRQALSSLKVLRMEQSDILPAGTWQIVVERPLESVVLREATAADVKVIAY